jgi:hypothetical protein
MGRYSSTTMQMRCAYCNRDLPWDTDHFPSRTYAQCWDCVRADRNARLTRRQRRMIRKGRCPDCERPLSNPEFRCLRRPAKGMVWGHGPAPTKAPPKRPVPKGGSQESDTES